MGTKIKTEKTTLDKRMKRELADHDRWVAECEKQQRDKTSPTLKSPKSSRKKTSDDS